MLLGSSQARPPATYPIRGCINVRKEILEPKRDTYPRLPSESASNVIKVFL